MRGSIPTWLLSVLVVGSACSGTRRPALLEASPSSTPHSSFSAAPRPAPTAEGRPPAPEATAKARCNPAEAARQDTIFEQVYSGAVSSLALGKKGRVAIVARPNAQLFDGTAWRAIEPVLADSAQVEIFFGRDNEPRLLGHSTTSAVAMPLYRRHIRGRWQPAADELGRLGTARTPLYGVLGHDDPEVVCAVGDVCLVKRLTGWASAPAHSELASLRLLEGVVFALRPGHVERLVANGWQALAPPREWARPSGVWADPHGKIGVIVVEEDKNAMYRLGDGGWELQSSPIDKPRMLSGRSSSDLWLVGEGGAAHFDGASWSCPVALARPLDSIHGTSEEIWVSGSSGVFRGRRARLVQ